MRDKFTRKECSELSEYLIGYADSIQNEKIAKASKYLKFFEKHICGQGFICRGGPNCTSDHK